jgi:copper oxidase (laccase) domain-containing protein
VSMPATPIDGMTRGGVSMPATPIDGMTRGGVSLPDDHGEVTRGPSVATRMVERMVELGAKPEQIRVALGPSIGACCFEVGPEVVAEFRAKLGELPGLVVRGPHKDHLDLRVAMRAILEGAGVRPEHIDNSPPCTRCDERFFSYRRDGRDGGMHMAFIGIR